MDRFILDSFAILAYLQGEDGAVAVRSILERAQAGQAEALVTLVNLGEVLYIIERESGLQAAQSALATLDSLPLTQREIKRNLALRAANFKANFRMAYADCFAAALADELGGTVVTGDPEFHSIEHKVPVFWLSNHSNADDHP